jgi:hypothetical protein
VTLHGAKVTAVTGSVITATTAWGNSATTWTIVTDNSTSITRQKGGKSSVSEITVGDIISVTGMLDQNASAFTVKAKSIRDYSIVQTESNLEGSIGSVNTALSSFVLKTEKLGDITYRICPDLCPMKSASRTDFVRPARMRSFTTSVGSAGFRRMISGKEAVSRVAMPES